jgi:anaerobic selenocysteine-containing dehydrogenase
MEIDRRKFLGMLGIAAGGAALSSCGVDPRWSVPEELVRLAQRGPGIETWMNTVCGQCSGGCGIKARLIDGIPVKIEGNKMAPLNRGGMCPQGAAGLDVLYNPDRLRSPMVRSGSRGSGTWKPVSWDRAMDMVVDRLSKLRAEENPHRVAVLKEDSSILMDGIFSQFMQAYGSPNLIDASDREGKYLAFKMTQGLDGPVSYDFANSKYILNFGANLFEEGTSPVHYMRAYKGLREQKGKRARIVHISPRRSTTGLKASEWITIKPAMYGIFALGIAHVLIKENLYDKEFVAAHTSGFTEWKQYVLKEFYPFRTSKMTGIPVEQILKISREFGFTKPSLAIGNQNATSSPNGLFNMLAIHSLNALAGNFEKPGGTLLTEKMPLREPSGTERDSVARSGAEKSSLDSQPDQPEGVRSMHRFIENILSDNPYQLDTLLIYNSNPLFTYAHQDKIRKAIEKIPFIVSFSNFIDETSEYADIIMPDHAWLEKWDSGPEVPAFQHPWLAIQRPVVEPFYDTRHTGDVIMTIASRINGVSISNENSLDLLKYRVWGLYSRGSGLVISEVFEGLWWDFLRNRGWQGLRHTNFNQFWQTMSEMGGWWEPVYRYGDWKRVFRNPEGKFNFVFNVSGRDVLSSEKGTESDKGGFPFHLNTFELLTNQKGKGANSPLLQEMFGFYQKQHWRSWVEINPETAERLHLHEGDIVEVESQKGKVRLHVKIYPVIMPDVVSIPFGQGHTSYGRYAKGIGINPYSIIKEDVDPISGLPSLDSTKVRIRKA